MGVKKIFSKIIPVLLIALICFGLGNSWTILPAISHVIVQEGHGFITSQQYAILALYLAAGALLASNVATQVGRFYGVKKALLGGVIAGILGVLLIGFGSFESNGGSNYRYLMFIGSQVLVGISVGAILTSATSFLVLFMYKRTAALITGAYACVNLGSSSAPFFISLSSNDWWLFSLMLSIFLFFLVLAIIRWLPNVHNPNALSREPLKVIFKKLPRFFWLFFVAIFLYAICEDCLVSWTTILLHVEKGIMADTATKSLAIFWIVVTVSQFLICGLVNRISPRPIYRLLPILLAAGIFGVVVAWNVDMNFLFFALAASGISAFFALTVNFAEKKFHQIVEFVSGALIIGYLVGNVTGSLTIGFLYETMHWKLSSIFVVIGLVGVALMPISFLLSKSTSSDS